MAVNKKIRESLPEEAIIFNNAAYDNSIIGITINDEVVYDYNLMVQELMDDNGWTVDEAIDWLEYKTIRALPYFNEGKPIIMCPIERGDME